MIRPHQTALYRVGAMLAVLTGLLAASQPARSQSDWAFCADEGQTCQVNGDTMVRFGADGRYAFRITRGPQPCDIDAFGSDPAPGRRKQCEISLAWRNDARYRGWRDVAANATAGNWRRCAAEGGVCVVNGSARVRFGANGRYSTLQVTDRVTCNVRTFTDPAPGQAKTCEVEETGPAWVLCANEGDVCRVPGSAQVRYGSDGRYAERLASDSIACNNAQFGDPVPGIAKQCEYLSGSGAAAAAALPWDVCAPEGGFCSFRGPGMLRYGIAGRYAYREASNRLQCRSEEFGTDPAPGVAKQCELLRLGR